MRTPPETPLSELARRATEEPGRIHVEDVEGSSLSYAETATEARRWAAAYRSIGVEADEIVVTMQNNTIESLLGWHGLGWLGATEAPVNVDYRADLLVHALNLTRARTMACLGQFVPRLLKVADRLEHLRQVVVLDDGDVPELPWPSWRMAELLAEAEQAFNMTELSCPVGYPVWNADRFDERGRASQGTVRPGYAVRIVDEHDQPLPPGEVGEIVIRSDVPWVLNAGYLNMPEATAEAWRGGWFHTGDAGYLDEEGWFYFIDRLKDCIRRRDENISSYDVEMSVMAHPEVALAGAIAVKENDRPGANEEVKVCCVRTEGSALDGEGLVRWLIGRMPRFMVPRYVEFFDELPLTPTQKVRKVELPKSPLTERTFDREAAGIEIPRDG